MSSRKSCFTCDHWAQKHAAIQAHEGRCCAHPPTAVAINNVLMGAWAGTKMEESCGEWKALIPGHRERVTPIDSDLAKGVH